MSRLLAGQRRGLDHVRMDDYAVIPMLEAVAEMGGCRVKTLDLVYVRPKTIGDIPLLATILSKGGLRGIEELKCSIVINIVLGALADGACPQLRKLSVGRVWDTGNRLSRIQAAESLLKAMRAGYCRRLEELEIGEMPPQWNIISSFRLLL